jgi:hypothetical protein
MKSMECYSIFEIHVSIPINVINLILISFVKTKSREDTSTEVYYGYWGISWAFDSVMEYVCIYFILFNMHDKQCLYILIDSVFSIACHALRTYLLDRILHHVCSLCREVNKTQVVVMICQISFVTNNQFFINNNHDNHCVCFRISSCLNVHSFCQIWTIIIGVVSSYQFRTVFVFVCIWPLSTKTILDEDNERARERNTDISREKK